jgi:hypothetical protein
LEKWKTAEAGKEERVGRRMKKQAETEGRKIGKAGNWKSGKRLKRAKKKGWEEE